MRLSNRAWWDRHKSCKKQMRLYEDIAEQVEFMVGGSCSCMSDPLCWSCETFPQIDIIWSKSGLFYGKALLHRRQGYIVLGDSTAFNGE